MCSIGEWHPHNPKTCMFRPLKDSKFPLNAGMRVNGACMCVSCDGLETGPGWKVFLCFNEMLYERFKGFLLNLTPLYHGRSILADKKSGRGDSQIIAFNIWVPISPYLMKTWLTLRNSARELLMPMNIICSVKKRLVLIFTVGWLFVWEASQHCQSEAEMKGGGCKGSGERQKAGNTNFTDCISSSAWILIREMISKLIYCTVGLTELIQFYIDNICFKEEQTSIKIYNKSSFKRIWFSFRRFPECKD